MFLLNNRGYSMIQQTQDQWFDSRYEASTVEAGLASPDFARVAEARVVAVVKRKWGDEWKSRSQVELGLSVPLPKAGLTDIFVALGKLREEDEGLRDVRSEWIAGGKEFALLRNRLVHYREGERIEFQKLAGELAGHLEEVFPLIEFLEVG